MVDSFKMADNQTHPNISTQSVMRFYQRAKELMKSGRNDDAFDSFTEFIRNEDAVLEAGYRDELARAYNERGHIRYLRVDFGNAIDDYTKSIHLDEEFAVAYYNRGQVHYRLGEKCVLCNSYKLVYPYIHLHSSFHCTILSSWEIEINRYNTIWNTRLEYCLPLTFGKER